MTVWGRVFQRLLLALYRQRVILLLVVVLVAAAGTYQLYLARTNLVNEAQGAGLSPIEVTVQDLQGNVNQGTLTLKEKNGSRRISMGVGVTEYLAILSARDRNANQQIPPDQNPQAYDLLRDTVQQMGGRINRVLVNDANQRQYLAEIVVSSPDGDTKVIHARPGDAVALALKAGAPIYVEETVLDRFGTKGSG